MENVKTLLFDMDDTLIETQGVFNHYKSLIASKIKKQYNLEEQEILKRFSEIDLLNVKKYGLTPKRFITSWNELLLQIDKDNESLIKEINQDLNKMFKSSHEKYDEVDETLTYLKQKYQLILITAGDYHTQIKKIEDADFNSIFDKIYIASIKNIESYKEVVKENSLNVSETVMIGNSLSSDIYPATEIGIKGIHVKKDTWVFDNKEVANDYIEIKDVKDLKNIL